MEEDERKKKLRAGKEKLAAFRKKKTKRKRQSDVAEGFDDEAVSPVRSDSSLDSSAEYTSSSDVSYASCEDPDSDGMSGDEISGQADMREIIKTRSKLRQAEDRISELEESLMGKQLALDNVIQENTQLKSKSEVKKLEELEAAVLKRDDIIKHLTVQLQLGVPNESQQQYRMETENLAKQVQLLQSQLQKAGQLLQSQSDKQNMSSQALQDAKTQILNLQDVITEKNTVLNQVSQNLNKFTEEYSALKNMYETVKQRESETNQVVQQLMVDAEVMRKQDKQNESVGKSSDDTDDTEKKLQALRSELEEMYGLQIAEMKQEVIQQFNLEKESLIKERDMLLAEMAKVKEDYQNAVQQSEEYIREKDNLSDELDKMSEDYEKETNRVREIQHKLKEFEAIVNNTSELQQECKLLRVQNDELKNKINSQQDSVVELKAELEILSNENIRFKDQMACLTQELDKQCNENSVAVHEKTKLSEQLNSLDNELLVARQENKSHMDKIDSMKDVIHSLRGELESSEKEKEELAQKCDDISKSVHVERQKRDQEIERLKHQLENKSDRTVNSDISTDSQVWEDSDTLTDSKIDSCHRNSVDLLTSQEQQVLDIIDKVLDVDENVCETDSVAAYRDPHVLTTENIFIETDNIEPEIDIPMCENNQMISETDNKLSESGNKICNYDTLNSETDYKLSGSPQVEEQMDKVVNVTLDTENISQPKSSVETDIVEPLAEVSEIHFQSHTIHSDSFDDKDSGVISESMTFDLDGESLKVRESELQPIGTEHFQSRLEQVTNENEAFKLDIKKLNKQIEVMNTELELLKEDRQKLQVELDIVKHEKSTSTHEHSEENKYDSETTAVNKDGHQNVYGEKMISLETEFNQSIDEKLENLLEENEELRKNLTDVSIELEKVKCEDYSELERSELEDKVHQMELKINSYVAGEASLLQENEQLKELNSELQLQVDELQVREKDLKLLKVEMDETVEVKERDFQKMVEEQMVEHEEFDFEKEELLKTNREMRKELDQLSMCEQNTRDECELLEEKCKILDTEIKEYEMKTSDLEAQNQTLALKVGDLEELLNSVKLDEESHSVGEQKAKDECEMLLEKCKILDTDIREYESKTANLEAQNQALTLKIEDLEKLLNTVKLDEQSPASSDEVKVQDSSNEDLLNSKEDLLNKIEDLEAKVESLSIEKADLQEKEVTLAMVMEEKNKSDEKMLEFQERTREKIEELTNTINEKEERLRQTENRYDTEIQILKTENQKLVKSLEDDLKNATEREEMLQTNAEKFRFEMEALIDKNEYLSKLVDELQTPGVTSTNDDVEIQLEEKVVAETISECENVYGTTASPSVVTSDTPSDSYKPEMAEVQKKSARKSLMKQFSKDSLEDRESSVEKEVPGVDSCDQVEEESEDVVNMVRNSSCMLASNDGLYVDIQSVDNNVHNVYLSTENFVENALLSARNSNLQNEPNIMQPANSNCVDDFYLDLVLRDENYFDSVVSNLQTNNSVLLEKFKLMLKRDSDKRILLSDIENILTENCHILSRLKLFCVKLAKESVLFKNDMFEKDSDAACLTSVIASLQTSSQVMKSENTNLESKVHSQPKEIEKLESENKNLDREVHSQSKEIEKLEFQNTNLESKVHLQPKEIEKLQVEISSLLRNKETLMTELSELRDRCLYLNLQIGQYQEKSESKMLQTENSDLRAKVTELENKVSEFEKIWADKQNMIDILTNENRDIMATITRKDEIIAETTKEFDMVSMEIKNIKEENLHLKTENNKFESMLDGKDTLENQTQRDVEKLKSLNDNLKRENAELMEECDSFKSQLMAQADGLNSYKCNQKKLEKENTEMREKIGNLQTCCERLEKENSEMNICLVQLGAELTEKVQLLEKKEDLLEMAGKEKSVNLIIMEEDKMKISLLETNMNELVIKLTETEMELNKTSEKLEAVCKEKESKETDINEVVTKLTERETELNKTTEKLEAVCKEKESMESEINEFVTKLTERETELNSTLEKLEAVCKEKESMESDISEFVTKLKDRETELNKTSELLEAVCKEKDSLENETTSNLAEIVDLKEKIEKHDHEYTEMIKERQLLEEEIVKLRNHYDKEEEIMKSEKDQLKNEKDELQVKVGELEVKCKQEKESFEEKLKCEKEHFEEQLENEKQIFDEKLEKQKERFEEQLKNEKEDFEGQLEKQIQNFEEQLEKQKQDFDVKIESYDKLQNDNQELQLKLEDLEENRKQEIESFEEKLKNKKEHYEEQFEKQKQNFEEQLEKQKEEFKGKIETENKNYKEQLEMQKQNVEEKLEKQKEDFEEKMKKESENYKEQLEMQKQNFEEKLEKQKEDFEEKMKKESENYKEQLKMQKQNFEEKLEKQKEDFEEKMKKEKGEFDAKIEIYDGKMIDIVTNGKSVKESCETMMEEVKKERDVKAEDLRSMTESYDLLKQEFNDMKRIIQEFEEERESARNKIRTLEDELETSRNKLKDLEEKIAFTERLEVYDGESSEKDDLREELISLKSNCEKLRNELNFKDSELEVIKIEKSEFQNKIQELENKNEDLRNNENELELLQARTQELEEENELLKENRDELESELGTAAESLQTAVKRRGNSNTEMDDLRKELHALTEIRNELMAQVESLGSNLTDSRKLSEELSQELKKVAVEKDKEISKNKQLVMEKKGLKLKLEKLERGNGKLQAAVENLKKENSQLLEARKENSDTAEKFNNLNEKIIELDEEVKMERKEKMRYIEIAEQYGNIEDELKMEREEKMKYLKSAETLTLQHEETVKKCEELEETVKLEQNKRKDIERQYQIMVEDIEALKLKRDDLLETKEDMADCLQDLQSKYEDVRSLMEGTQKEYEKEIGDLQTQLNNVGDNFKSLTSVVDSLENDLKEKNKENEELMSSLQQERDLRGSLSAEQDHQNTFTAKNQKDHKNRTMMGSSQNEREIQEQEAGVQTEIDFTTMEGLIQIANNDSGFLVVEENLQCQEVYSLESLLPQVSQSLCGNHSNNIEQTPKTTGTIQTNQLESNSHLFSESEIAVCSSDDVGDFVETERSFPVFQSETMQREQISTPAFRSESVEENQVSLPAFRSETAEHVSTPAFRSETAEYVSTPAFRSETAEYVSTPAFRSETAELEEAQILPTVGQCHEVQASIHQDLNPENQQNSVNLDEVQQKLLDEKLEDKMKEAMKHKEYDIQEKYELMFRDKQAEIMVRYDKEKKDYQKEMEQILKHKVETVKAEKDQAFVKSLQRMRKDFDKKHRREMEKLRLKLLQEIAEGDGTEMEEEIRDVVQKLNMENQELAEARDALLQQVNQLSHYRQEQLQQDPNLNIGQHGAATDESSSKQETTNEEPVIQNRHQYRSQSLMLDWEFSPHSSFDYDGDGFDEHLGDTDEDICLRPECQVLRHRLQVISEHLIEGFKPESSGSPESSCDYNAQEHGQGFKPEDDFLSASGNNEFVTTPTTELESSFVREALRMEVESAKKRLESTKSGVDDVFVSSKTENIESKDQEQDARSSTPDPNVIKEGFISDSSNQNTPTNSPLRRSLSNQEDGFIAESDMSKLQDIGRRFRDRMSSQEKKEQFIEDTKTRQNLSLSGDGFIAESDPKNVFNIQKTDIKRSKSVPLAKIMISSPERNIHTEKRPGTAPSEVSTNEDAFIAESSTTNMADNSGNDSNKLPKMLGNFSDVKISLSQGSKYAPGEEAINYLKTGDTHFIGEGFVSSEITKVKNELDNFSSIPKETDAPGAENSGTRNDFQSIEEENTLLKQEKLKLEMKVKDILKMYNKEKNELMDECNRIKIKLENETLCRQQLEQELLEFNEDFEKTGQDDDDENLGKEESRTSKSESASKVSSGFQMMQDIVKEKDKIISDYDKKLHRSFESLENSEKKCDELEKLVGSLEEIVKDKEEDIKELKEEMNKKLVDVSNEYSVMTLDDLERPLNKSLAEKSVGIESPQYKRTELTENLSEKFKKQVLTLQRELEKKNKLVEELSLNGDVEMKLLKQKLVEFEKLLTDKDHYIGKLEEELEHLTKMVNDQFDFVDYRAKMEQSFKEKEKYIKTLEEHFLKHDTFDSSPKSAGSASRTSPVRTSSPSQAGLTSFQDSGIGRQEYKTPITRNQFPDVDFWNFSTSSTVSAQRSLFRSTGSHYGSSDQRSLSSYSGSSGEQEQIRSGLGPEEDGHYALELKHFKLVDEISGLRRELRETKAIYNKENSLLQEALEKEKMRKDLNNSLSPKSETYSVDQTLQINELKQNISVLQESNRMLQIENDKWLKRVQEQECIVLELQAQTTSEVDDGRIEKIYGQQIKQLQNQRNDLMERLREINMENTNLSFQLGEKAILEETLRREKDLLKAKLSEKDDIEKELRDKTVELEKQIKAQVKLEEVLDHKNQVEKELMRQKRMLELELSEIECKLREKEELLQMQKDDLMREMREKDSSRVSSLYSSRSDLTSEASSYASSVLSTQSSPAHMGRLDSMLDRARKQHTYAVDSLKHVLKSEQEPHDTRFRDRHRPSLTSLRSQHFHKVPRK